MTFDRNGVIYDWRAMWQRIVKPDEGVNLRRRELIQYPQNYEEQAHTPTFQFWVWHSVDYGTQPEDASLDEHAAEHGIERQRIMRLDAIVQADVRRWSDWLETL